MQKYVLPLIIEINLASYTYISQKFCISDLCFAFAILFNAVNKAGSWETFPENYNRPVFKIKINAFHI